LSLLELFGYRYLSKQNLMTLLKAVSEDHRVHRVLFPRSFAIHKSHVNQILPVLTDPKVNYRKGAMRLLAVAQLSFDVTNEQWQYLVESLHSIDADMTKLVLRLVQRLHNDHSLESAEVEKIFCFLLNPDQEIAYLAVEILAEHAQHRKLHYETFLKLKELCKNQAKHLRVCASKSEMYRINHQVMNLLSSITTSEIYADVCDIVLSLWESGRIRPGEMFVAFTEIHNRIPSQELDPRIYERAVEALKGKAKSLRDEAAKFLLSVKSMLPANHNDRVINVLPEIRQIIRTFPFLGAPTPVQINKIVKLLTSGKACVAANALQILLQEKPESIHSRLTHVANLLKSDHSNVVSIAATVLTLTDSVKHQTYIPNIIELLGHRDKNVCMVAFHCLDKVRTSLSEDNIENLLWLSQHSSFVTQFLSTMLVFSVPQRSQPDTLMEVLDVLGRKNSILNHIFQECEIGGCRFASGNKYVESFIGIDSPGKANAPRNCWLNLRVRSGKHHHNDKAEQP